MQPSSFPDCCRQVTLYRQAKNSSDFKYYGKYLTSLTLKDISSVTEIAISSGQPWNKRDRDKYMANDVTSVMVGGIQNETDK